ncbi:MAG: ASKHA domain-containing protein, partial [Halanaerobiales bacterium]
LQEKIIDGINQAIINLSEKNDIPVDDIYLITIVGNTIMLHFLLAEPADSLVRPPYQAVFTEARQISFQELNIRGNSDGIVQLLPSVSAYLGADIVADLLISNISGEDWNLLIDIGTNGEIVLAGKERILGCTTAAGPAFEGANISQGMPALPGAISQFEINNKQEFLYQTIAGEEPRGICGSALIDIIAELLDKNIINSTGAFDENMDLVFRKKMTIYQDMESIKIIEDILLTQKDIREFQLAKAAIAAGIKILLNEAGITENQINNIYLAGGFANFINIDNASKIGLFPDNLADCVFKIGNAAGTGAKACLLDKKELERAKLLAEKIEYFDLALHKDFQSAFIDAIEF